MRKNVVVVILISMLIISACSFSNAKETKQNLVEACSETPSEADVSIEQSSEDSFMAQMPIHSGIWQVADYGQTEYYYEFSKDYTGRRVNALGVVIEEFSYEQTNENNLVIHYADRDEYAHFCFGDDGKHLVLTYQDYQQTFLWISHGTLEDMGGLGLTFNVEDITPLGCTISYTQEGGYVTGEIVADKCFQILFNSEDYWCSSGWFGEEDQYFTIEKNSHGELSLDWSKTGIALEPGTYVLEFKIRDIRNSGGDWDSFSYRVWFVVPEYGNE